MKDKKRLEKNIKMLLKKEKKRDTSIIQNIRSYLTFEEIII